MSTSQGSGRRIALALIFGTIAAPLGWCFPELLNVFKANAKVKVKVTVNIPFSNIQADIETDETQRQAAWALYIELATRITSQPLAPDEGLLREAFNSLYKLFDITRQVLKQTGPGAGVGENSVGGIAIEVLNKGLRPFLAKWHPKLQDWETKKPEGISQLEHEYNWPEKQDCRADLEDLRQGLQEYVKALGEIAGTNVS